MPAAHSDSVTFSLPIWMPVISFPCLIVVSQISNTLFNTSGKSGYPYLVPDFRGKTFSFLPLSMMLAVDLPLMDFIMLRHVLSILTLRVFIMNSY